MNLRKYYPHLIQTSPSPYLSKPPSNLFNPDSNKSTMKFLYLLSAFTAMGTVAALPQADSSPIMVKRDPKDKSGKSQMVLQCDGTTIPNPGGAGGEGEGGSSYFSKNMKFNANGKEIQPKSCKDKDSFCTDCQFEGGGLSSPTNVVGCWNPPGGKKGCSIKFKYNGHDYDSQNKQDKCGHQSGFKPFAFDLSAICYFDV